MKNFILIGGPMGVGKTAASRLLQRQLPGCAFLDGDWCWDMWPFVVTDETRAMVMDNICHVLGNFLRCSVFENIVFCWVMHEQSILDELLSRLDTTGWRSTLFRWCAARPPCAPACKRISTPACVRPTSSDVALRACHCMDS